MSDGLAAWLRDQIDEEVDGGRVYLTCCSLNRELAVKKVSDRFAKLRAERLGL